MNNNTCNTCEFEIADSDDALQCYGFCGQKFHFPCISKENKKYKKALINYLIDIPNLQWFCNECICNTINATYNGILKNLHQFSNVIADKIRNDNIQSQRTATQLNSSLASILSANSYSQATFTNQNQTHDANSLMSIGVTQHSTTAISINSNDDRLSSVGMEIVDDENNVESIASQNTERKKRQLNTSAVGQSPPAKHHKSCKINPGPISLANLIARKPTEASPKITVKRIYF